MSKRSSHPSRHTLTAKKRNDILRHHNHHHNNKTMRSILLLLVTYTALSSAFVPQQLVVYRATTLRASNTHHKPDMTGDIDIGHAKYCADHFGECSLEEMEKIRNGRYQTLIFISSASIYYNFVCVCFSLGLTSSTHYCIRPFCSTPRRENSTTLQQHRWIQQSSWTRRRY